MRHLAVLFLPNSRSFHKKEENYRIRFPMYIQRRVNQYFFKVVLGSGRARLNLKMISFASNEICRSPFFFLSHVSCC